MRRAVLLSAVILWALPGWAQLAIVQTVGTSVQGISADSAGYGTAEPVVLDYAEQMPAFPGGATALHRFLVAHLIYPPEAFKAGRSGKVVVQFVVDEQGRTRDVEVVRTSNAEFDAAARHVVMVMPWWLTGVDKGRPVRVRCTLPIVFTFRRYP